MENILVEYSLNATSTSANHQNLNTSVTSALANSIMSHHSYTSASEALAVYDGNGTGNIDPQLAKAAAPRRHRKKAEEVVALQPHVHYVPDLADGRGSAKGNWFYGHGQRLALHSDLEINPTAQAVPVPVQKDRRDYWLLKSCARATSPNVGPGRYTKPVAQSHWAKLARQVFC